MNSTTENGQNNSQGPSVIGNKDAYSDASDENGVNHELRPQRANFRRSVSEGPQTQISVDPSIPEVAQSSQVLGVAVDAPTPVNAPITVDAPITLISSVPASSPIPQVIQAPQVVQVSRSSSMVILNQVLNPDGRYPYERRTNSRSRYDHLYNQTHKVQEMAPTERKTRSKKRIDYTEGQLPPGLLEEDLFTRCSTPPSKRKKGGDTESNILSIISPSDNEQQIHNNNPQDEVLCLFLSMVSITAICIYWSTPLLQSNLSTQITQRSGLEAYIATNTLPLTYEIPATGRQSSPELNEEPNIGANVGSRPNSGGELHVVVQPQNFSSDTHLIPGAQNFVLSDLAASRQGEDGVNNETLANGEVLDSVQNRTRDLDETSRRSEPHPQNHSPVHELNKENVNPVVLSSQQLYDHLSLTNQQRTHGFNVETSSDSCSLNNPVSGAKHTEHSPSVETPIHVPRPLEARNVDGIPAMGETRESFIRGIEDLGASDVHGTPAFEDTPAIEEEALIREPTRSPPESSPFYTDPIFDAHGNMTPAHPFYHEQAHPSVLENPSQQQAGPSSNFGRIPSQSELRGQGYRNSRIDWSSKKPTTKSTPYAHGGGAPSNQPVNGPSSSLRYRGNVASELRRKANQEKMKRLNKSRRNK